MMHYGFNRLGHFGGGGIYMILFWVLIIVGIIYLISKSNISLQSNNTHRTKRTNYSNNNQSRDPIDIAKERYAKGEINKEELNEIIQELKNK